MNVFSGLSSQGFGMGLIRNGLNQEFGLGAALKRKVQSHGRYKLANANFSERVHPEN